MTRSQWLLLVSLALFAAFLAGCSANSTPPVREITVTKEVPVPYYQPCPKAEDKPVVPKHVAEEHPKMPADDKAVARILADKVFELFGYAGQADAVMAECSKPR